MKDLDQMTKCEMFKSLNENTPDWSEWESEVIMIKHRYALQ